MRPVDAQFPVSQEFGSLATAGVAANPNGTEVQQLVAAYGNYQPYGHAGQDIACPIGTPVHAIADGTVLWADWGTNLPGDDSWGPSGYFRRWALYKTFPGIVTVIQHAGWISVYAHLSNAPLNPGDVVTEGQQIALSGNTRSPGVSLGAHLHVEAIVDLTYSTGNGLIYGRTDPTPYFGAISAQSSTITPTQEDNPLATASEQYLSDLIRAVGRIDAFCANPPEAFIEAIARRVHTRPLAYNVNGVDTGKATTLAALVSNNDSNILNTRQYVRDVVSAALGQVLASTGAPAAVDLNGIEAAIVAAIAKVPAPVPVVDVPAIAKAVNDDAAARRADWK